jgi:sialate O-acetylesterase
MKKIVLFLIVFFAGFSANAQIRLPKIVSDGMILQRDEKINIWGWASPGEKVTVQFDKKKYSTKTDAEGNWKIVLPAMPADGIAHNITVTGKNAIQIKDVLLGDVWFCSGQSNMVHQMNIHDVTYAKDIQEANFSKIRQFWVPNITNLEGPAQEIPSGEWVSAIGEKVRPFSAVAYFFARKVHQKYNVPVGIINASWGGSPIEAWISEDGFKDFNDILATISKNKDTSYVNQTNRAARGSFRPQKSNDLGTLSSPKWFEESYKPKGWKPINVPGYWEDQGIRNLDGVVWYRKTIDVPSNMTGKEAKVWLGRIVDADEFYINGKRIGGFGYMYPQRRYTVAADILKPGKNTLTVRVTNNMGKGGFVPDKPYCLFAGKDTIDLKGEWHYKVGEVFEPRTPGAGGPQGISAMNQPAAMYNSMVHPHVNYGIKGVLWYQGETNTGRANQYEAMLDAMISDWRNRWNKPELPVVYAQLPGFMEYDYLPSHGGWAFHREATLKALRIPHTAMTVNIDLGEWNDIHPENKKDVGERMALAAYKIAYGEDLVYSGPIYKSFKIEGNKIILEFDHVGSGLITNDDEAPADFAIAGEDKKFRWAKTKIEENKVIVWHDEIPNPQFVRYAWADNPVNPNLYNKEGLPASPFRTDN